VRQEERKPLLSEADWQKQFVTDFCQSSDDHVLIQRKPALNTWRSWYLRCMRFDMSQGDLVLRRWRSWMLEEEQGEWTGLQRMAFEGQLHLIEAAVEDAEKQGLQNPFFGELNILVYAVLSRSIETVEYFLTHGFAAEERLHAGEVWTGFTALHVAIFIQHREMASLLWNKFEANVNRKDLFFGSVLDYCKLLGLVTNCQVYFKGENKGKGYNFGYQTMEHVVQVTMRGPLEWNAAEKDQFETRNVKEAKTVRVKYWSKKSKEMEAMPLEEWSDLAQCVYQPFISANDSWLDELMFNRVYIEDVKSELREKYAAFLDNAPAFSSPENVVMCYVNSRIGFGCYAAKELQKDDCIVRYGGYLHSDRCKWKDVEKTTQFRLNFMKQIHDLGEKGEGIIKKPSLPHYPRNPNFNLAIPGTAFFVNSTECGNMGRMINHSAQPNARIEVIWSAGAPIPLVIAARKIDKGEQILLDYGSSFWEYFEEKKNRSKPKAEETQNVSWNFEEDEMLIIRDLNSFFKQADVVELSGLPGFPSRINIE
jgi:hypothetical protein